MPGLLCRVFYSSLLLADTVAEVGVVGEYFISKWVLVEVRRHRIGFPNSNYLQRAGTPGNKSVIGKYT